MIILNESVIRHRPVLPGCAFLLDRKLLVSVKQKRFVCPLRLPLRGVSLRAIAYYLRAYGVFSSGSEKRRCPSS